MCAGDAVKPSGKSFFTSRNYASTFRFPVAGHGFMMCVGWSTTLEKKSNNCELLLQ